MRKGKEGWGHQGDERWHHADADAVLIVRNEERRQHRLNDHDKVVVSMERFNKEWQRGCHDNLTKHNALMVSPHQCCAVRSNFKISIRCFQSAD
jgi:hypothetical protein